MLHGVFLACTYYLNDETGNQPFCRKKLFSFLKSSRADAQGIGVLRAGGAVCIGSVSSQRNNQIKLKHYDETKKRAHGSQIVRAQ